jgi:hypothetical protein
MSAEVGRLVSVLLNMHLKIHDLEPLLACWKPRATNTPAMNRYSRVAQANSMTITKYNHDILAKP